MLFKFQVKWIKIEDFRNLANFDVLVRARTCVAVHAKKKKTFKLCARNNNHTGRSFALACPYVCGCTCVPVCAWPYVQTKKKTFKQPHRPFLRSRKRRLDWGIVFIYKFA